MAKQPRPGGEGVVGSGAFAGALAACLVWALNRHAAADIPAEIAVAVTVLITFVVQHCVRCRRSTRLTP